MRTAFAALLLSACAFASSRLLELKTKFVRCAQDAKGNDNASAELKTPVIISKSGWKAYGLVRAEFNGEGCTNHTTILIARPNEEFREAYGVGVEKETGAQGSVYNGNGVARIDWSPAGDRLLAEIFQWTWGSDFGENNKYLIFAPGRPAPAQIFPEAVIRKRLRRNCSAKINSDGWIDDSRIRMIAKPWLDVENGSPSCIKQKTSFKFDIQSGTVAR